MPSRLASIKERIKELETLMNKLSDLSHDFQFKLNGGAVTSDVVELVEMWAKVKDLFQDLTLLDNGIDSKTEGLKDKSISDEWKSVMKRRLDDDVKSAERKLNRSITLERKSIELIASKEVEFVRQKELNKQEKKVIPVKEPVVEMPSDAALKTDVEFEQQHISNLRVKEQQLHKIYESAIQVVSIVFSQIVLTGEVFRIIDYPFLANKINSIIKGLRADIYSTVVNGITTSWELSFAKNNILVDKRLSGKVPSALGRKVLYDPNLEGLKQFIKRKDKGLNLSERVWNSLDTYKTEMETALGVGISEGRSAVEMAKDLKSYLNEPDRLFRKVRQDDGSLKLSNAARNFHPGQGVYRSSFQNALRLTASETNMSYRTADHERWQSLPFVIGFEVHLSNNHPEFDICDALKGVYPKDFLFRSWHPKCLCFGTPVMMSDDEYDKFEDAILDGVDPRSIKQISKPPVGFRNYVSKNAKWIKGWKSKPYWVKDNPDFVSI